MYATAGTGDAVHKIKASVALKACSMFIEGISGMAATLQFSYISEFLDYTAVFLNECHKELPQSIRHACSQPPRYMYSLSLLQHS